jgi:tetratricopeptide (TPR) repeat protein
MSRLFVRLALLGLLSSCAHSSSEAPASTPAAAAPTPAPTPTAETRRLKSEAEQLAMSGKYAEALPIYQRAWEQGLREPGVLYNAACSAALVGNKAEALTWLERAADAGLSQAKHMQSDSDLASVREDPAFARIAERVAANEAKLSVAQNPELRDELLRMVDEDQAVRHEAVQGRFQDKAVLERMNVIDRRNTARMKEIIAQVGWPTKTLVSERGARAAFLLVQHADLDPAFQKQCLALMEKAVADKEALGSDFAYLTDRVRVAESKPQLYGTQFYTVEGKLVPRPIEDEAHVDARRAAVGLGTMEEYTAQMRQMASGASGGK